MKPHFHQPSRDPLFIEFPSLPILPADEARRLTNREKYGGLFYLGIGGLFVLVGLVGWFGVGVWTMKTLWIHVYVLHDASRSDSERIAAAYAIARDPSANQRQRWDIALERSLPPLARYLIAESLNGEAAVDDPRAYGLAVSKSEDWPNWLRLLLTRPMIYAAAAGSPVSIEALEALSRHSDPAIALWARCGLALRPAADSSKLRSAAQADGPDRALARFLLEAVETNDLPQRIQSLDQATAWLRSHHPEASRLWNDYRLEGDHLIPAS